MSMPFDVSTARSRSVLSRAIHSLFAIVATLVLVVGITACQSNQPSAENSQTVTAQQNEQTHDLKVVAGTVSVAQILDKLGYKQVVGVPKTQYDLGSYNDVPKVGLPPKPDTEIIKSLNPDLFISVTSFKESLAKTMDGLHIDSIYVDLGTYDKLLESIKQIGEAVKYDDEAAKLVADIETQAATAVKKSTGKTTPKVLYLFGTPKSVMAGSEKSFVGSLIQKLNATNIAGTSEQPYTPLSMEHIVSENPDVIVITALVDPKASKEMMQSTFDSDPAWKSTNAFKNNKVVYLSDDLFNVNGNVHVGEALDQLADILYPSN